MTHVVLDPHERADAERLAKALDSEFASRGWASQDTPDPDVVDAVQAALAALAGCAPSDADWQPAPPPCPLTERVRAAGGWSC